MLSVSYYSSSCPFQLAVTRDGDVLFYFGVSMPDIFRDRPFLDRPEAVVRFTLRSPSSVFAFILRAFLGLACLVTLTNTCFDEKEMHNSSHAGEISSV